MSFSWYIVQAHSGHEKYVAKTVVEKAEKANLSDCFEEVIVPSENRVAIKKGRKVTQEHKFFPGYVLVKMKMDERAWHLVKTVPKVTGFLGGEGKPQPISNSEAERILQQMQEGVEKKGSAVMFEIGEAVKVIDGPFESFTGTVEEIDNDKETLKVSVSIFGRATPVELTFSQVEKI